MPSTVIPGDLLERLRAVNTAFARRYVGESGRRQPVHTVYGGAHLFRADTARKLGQVALRALDEYAPDFAVLATAVGLPGAALMSDPTTLRYQVESSPEKARAEHPDAWLAHTVYERVVEKLRREPVEDYRLDYEDGYGNRPDDEEDGHARSGAREVAAAMREGTLPPFIGIRVKPLTEELRARSLGTLDIFLSTLVEAAGRLPEGFVVTLPKVTVAEQAAVFADVLALHERRLGLPDGTLRFEVMVETPQLVIGADGRSALPMLLGASQGRLLGAHFGTYDYTAACNITAAHQHMRHPACDFARHAMQVAFAGTGVWLSDGATSVMPVPVHRPSADGTPLTHRQIAENHASVHRAWRMHYDDIRHSLVGGFYQGWDLHPAQLVTRYAAVFAFFLAGLDAAAERLKAFVGRAAQATLVGDVFDDAATGQGLLNYFLRATNSGAVGEDDVARMTGLTVDELRTRSFVKILAGRRETGEGRR